MKPYYHDDWVTIYHGDCKSVLKHLPSQSVDLILTSPPYNIGLHNTRQNWGSQSRKDWYSDTLSEGEYQRQQRDIVAEMLRVAKVVCYNHKLRQRSLRQIHPLSWLPMEHLYQEIVWDKRNTPQIHPAYFYQVDERIFVLTTSSKEVMKNNQGLTTVWPIPTRQRTGFPNAFPLELARRCIRAFTVVGGLVLDPYLGSGTTVFAAKELNRKCVGIEIKEKYCEIATIRYLRDGVVTGGNA